MQNPLFSKLSMARRAGLVEHGFDLVKEAVQKGRAELVITASDLSAKTLKEVNFFCKDKVRVLCADITMQDILNGIGVKAGVLCVNDKGFADAVYTASLKR